MLYNSDKTLQVVTILRELHLKRYIIYIKLMKYYVIHCLSVLRNKCAHAARMYNTDFNPPAKFTTSFLRKHPEIKNNSLFAYTLVLLKRLPGESSKKSLIQTVENVISEYSDDIDLKLIGFTENYMEIMKNNL